MLKREAEHIYTVRIYQLEIAVPVSESLFFILHMKLINPNAFQYTCMQPPNIFTIS